MRPVAHQNAAGAKRMAVGTVRRRELADLVTAAGRHRPRHKPSVEPRGGEVLRVRRRAIIGVHGGAGWASIGQIRLSIAEVAETMGDALTSALKEDQPSAHAESR